MNKWVNEQTVFHSLRKHLKNEIQDKHVRHAGRHLAAVTLKNYEKQKYCLGTRTSIISKQEYTIILSNISVKLFKVIWGNTKT